jgi:YidC/Oxa1 family membrane protein insertase
MNLRAILLLSALFAVGWGADYSEVAISNPVARVVVSTQRASISRFELLASHPIALPKHLQREEPGAQAGAQPLAVLAPFAVPATATALENATNQHCWLANDAGTTTRWGLTGKDFAAWTVAEQASDRVTLRWDNSRGLRYEITWKMHATLPRVEARIAVTNTGTADVTVNPSIVPINGIHQDYAPNEVAYLTAFLHRGGVEAGSIEKHSIPGSDKGLVPVTENGTGIDFVGLKSRFFAVWWTPGELAVAGAAAPVAAPVEVGASGPGAQVPAPVAAGSAGTVWRADIGGYKTQAHADQQAWIQVTYGAVAIPAGKTLVNTWSLTASGMTRSALDAFGPAEHRIDLTDWMHRTFIIFTKPLVWVLDQLVKLVTNYAVAVIILTLLVKAAMFRLTWKQHASMIAMQKLQPELKYLQEQYKNDKSKLAQKQMELWKKNGVNPLGGCLPLLIQIPIFIALYNAFQYNADMRGEQFLWITDLTLPDQIWGTPLAFLGGWILSINPLPILYIAVTIWMSLTSPLPTGGDPQQEQMAKTMRWMPVLFGVIFYNMPAGLVLYFTVNAVLSTIEVKFIRARLAARK